ncbi:hypothetical protein HMPREF9333_00328 [Johnsonella ignava ATCC 51276]|jgi:hypothetical protein|uniref:Peptidase S54 rhomboid domain-containing protein n=1 Tax=Johnsonella ignava ATCC 51276 TaxID=679200 RepID=G5GFI9_9FIRM|nr:hypothetical protein [Johnsonella ignava]EHI56466.1 hypothetical protein HMPREF9333_00328 [Johnsonella ignava ATCC 51276]
MKFFDNMESKFSKYAIKNLSLYIAVIYCLGFLINMWNNTIYVRYLSLDVYAILQGQFWRLFTWLLYPPSSGILFAFVMTYLYYVLGTSIEMRIGSFKYNVFIFTGILGHLIAAFIVFAYNTNVSGYVGNTYYITPGHLNLSIFLAYTLLEPDSIIWMYFVLPVKIKYLSVIYVAMEGYSFFKGDMLERIVIALCLLNVMAFFLLRKNWKRVAPDEIKRRYEFKKPADRTAVKIVPFTSIHKCHVCGRTEKDGDDLEFRYCSKCNGNYEYCQEHLYTHIHVK